MKGAQSDTMTPARAAVLCLALAAAAPASAQTSTADVRVGFGASISSISGAVSPGFLIPIDAIAHFRIEPEIAYSRSKNELTTTSSIPIITPGLGFTPVLVSATSTSTVTSTSTTIGTGVFFVDARDRVRLQYGARFGYVHSSTEATSSTTTSGPAPAIAPSSSSTTSRQSGYFVGPAIGGEYFLADRFSLGAELHLRYTSTDIRQQFTSVISPPLPPGAIVVPPPKTSSSQNTLQTRASIVARIYIK